MAVTDTRTRSVVKALSWRVIASLLTITIAWLVTGDVSDAIAVGGIDVVVKLIAFYLHERTWQNLEYGRLDKARA